MLPQLKLNQSGTLRKEFCALLRLIYLRSDYESSDYIVNNNLRWEFCIEMNPDWRCYDKFVQSMINKLPKVNWVDLSLDEHLSLNILLSKAMDAVK